MRCWMSVSKPRIGFLATSEAVGYAAAHDERTENRDVERGAGDGHERLRINDQA